ACSWGAARTWSAHRLGEPGPAMVASYGHASDDAVRARAPLERLDAEAAGRRAADASGPAVDVAARMAGRGAARHRYRSRQRREADRGSRQRPGPRARRGRLPARAADAGCTVDRAHRARAARAGVGDHGGGTG